MGLDMYLNARITTFKPFGDEVSPARDALVTAAEAVGLKREPGQYDIDCIQIERQVAYWRKVNAIHAWFVRECQGGTDDCRHAYVGRDQLIELRALCEQLLARKNSAEAAEKLPPQSGFFFGSTDIDQYYWDDLADTVEQLGKAIFNTPDDAEFYYHSSW
jgi:hypothetical protein